MVLGCQRYRKEVMWIGEGLRNIKKDNCDSIIDSTPTRGHSVYRDSSSLQNLVRKLIFTRPDKRQE